MKETKTLVYRVVVEVPAEATLTEVREYVRDAVSCHRGSLEPPNEENKYTGDLCFALECVSVRRIL